MSTPLKGSRWGILGGRFDPVHFGHLTLAEEARRMQRLDGVLLVPSHFHPHKSSQARASYADRVAMLRLAIAQYDFMEVSEIEASRNLSGYTLDTVRTIKKQFPETEFSFIIGADNLGQFEKWHQPEEIVREVVLIAGARPNHALSAIDGLPADRVVRLDSALVDVSSTQVREMLASATDYSGLADLVPAEVIEYIKQRRLYR